MKHVWLILILSVSYTSALVAQELCIRRAFDFPKVAVFFPDCGLRIVEYETDQKKNIAKEISIPINGLDYNKLVLDNEQIYFHCLDSKQCLTVIDYLSGVSKTETLAKMSTPILRIESCLSQAFVDLNRRCEIKADTTQNQTYSSYVPMTKSEAIAIIQNQLERNNASEKIVVQFKELDDCRFRLQHWWRTPYYNVYDKYSVFFNVIDWSKSFCSKNGITLICLIRVDESSIIFRRGADPTPKGIVEFQKRQLQNQSVDDFLVISSPMLGEALSECRINVSIADPVRLQRAFEVMAGNCSFR